MSTKSVVKSESGRIFLRGGVVGVGNKEEFFNKLHSNRKRVIEMDDARANHNSDRDVISQSLLSWRKFVLSLNGLSFKNPDSVAVSVGHISDSLALANEFELSVFGKKLEKLWEVQRPDIKKENLFLILKKVVDDGEVDVERLEAVIKFCFCVVVAKMDGFSARATALKEQIDVKYDRLGEVSSADLKKCLDEGIATLAEKREDILSAYCELSAWAIMHGFALSGGVRVGSTMNYFNPAVC